MNLKHIVFPTVICFQILLSNQALAVGQGWLSDAPIRYFTAKDSELMMSAVKDVLDKGENGVTREWKNPETGNFGSVTAVDRQIINSSICRHAVIKNNAKGNSASSRFLLCQDESGEWKFNKK